MPRSLGTQLPPNLLGLFDGSDLAGRIGHTFLLLTTDPQGWPHLAMLSVGELLAADPSTLHAALWTSSSATESLSRDGRALLALVEGGAAYYLRVRAQRQADIDLGAAGPRAHFALAIEDVREDAVSYATLTSGVTFSLNDPAQVLPRWQETVAALRRAALGSTSAR